MAVTVVCAYMREEGHVHSGCSSGNAETRRISGYNVDTEPGNLLIQE